MSEFKMTIEDVSPQMAAEWLTQNRNNRPLRTTWATVLSNRIARGEWVLTHQGIAFSSDGNLIDGQHRLKAIELSGKTCRIAVFRGLSKDAFRVLDQGVKRSMADLSGLDRRVVDAVSLACRYFFSNSQRSYQQFEAILQTNLSDQIFDLVNHCGTSARTYSSAPIKLAAALTATNGPAERAYAFRAYAALVHLDFDAMPHVAHALVRQVASGLAGNRGGLVWSHGSFRPRVSGV